MIQAIETEYAGCRFRSRLEARWAIFFDKLGVEWQYEPQGFTLPSGRQYLPDFRLPQLGLWVEVKGDEREFQADAARYSEAALHLDGVGLMVLGPVPDIRLGLPQHFVLTSELHCCGQRVVCLHVAWVTMLCHAEGVRDYGLPCTDLASHDPRKLPALKGYNYGRARYTDPGPVDWPLDPEAEAYVAARSARFEHGERG